MRKDREVHRVAPLVVSKDIPDSEIEYLLRDIPAIKRLLDNLLPNKNLEKPKLPA